MKITVRQPLYQAAAAVVVVYQVPD